MARSEKISRDRRRGEDRGEEGGGRRRVSISVRTSALRIRAASASIVDRAGSARSGAAPPRCAACAARAAPFPTQVHFCISSLPRGAVGLQVDAPRRSRRRRAPAARNSRRRASPSAHRPRRVLVVEEQLQPLALDDQRVERREDVHRRSVAPARSAAARAPPAVAQCSVLPAPSIATGTSSAAAHAPLDQLSHRGLARRVEVADGIEADDALRAQRAVEQVVVDTRAPSRARAASPSRNAGRSARRSSACRCAR